MNLQIENLSKTYPNGVRALNKLNLTIQAGMFGLLGPNGAGKSTLMRILATLQEADEGSVRLDELDVLAEKEAVRRLLGYLPQEFGVYPRVSAQELLNHYAVLKGLTERKARKETVARLLAQVNLYEVRRQHVSRFSGGMKQRFGIALALLGNPKLIIVDEPTAGLDPAERVRFNNLLSEISTDKIVILSTHIVDDVSDLCGQMAIINKGEVLLTGRPSTIMQELEGKIWAKRIEKEAFEGYMRDYKIIYSHLNEGQPLIHVFDEEAPGEGFISVQPSLEDVYFTTIE